MPALTLALGLLQAGGFFERSRVEFWGPSVPAAVPAEPLWPDSTAPGPARRLLEAPTPEHARAYLAWQAERLRRVREAAAALRRESMPARPPGELLYFSREGCRWCRLQDLELEGLAVTRVPEDSPLWAAYGVTSTPTLVAGGRIFRGFTPRAEIEGKP